MKAESMIPLQLEFAGAILPVVINDQGEKVVPLKPIVDVIGLEWERQRKKVAEPYLIKRLGICTVKVREAGQQREMICIRSNRVVAFLNIIDPQELREQGNNPAADFLETKQAEWASLIN